METWEGLGEMVSRNLERLIPFHLERLLPQYLAARYKVHQEPAQPAAEEEEAEESHEEFCDPEEQELEQHFVDSLGNAPAPEAQVEVIDLLEDSASEEAEEDTQELLANRPRLAARYAEYLMAKHCQNVHEKDSRAVADVAASLSTADLRGEVLKTLREIPEELWAKDARRRPNVLRKGQTRSLQMTLGLVTCAFYKKLPQVARETWAFPRLCQLILIYLDRLAKEQGMKPPQGTTVQLTKNLETQWHRDGNNGGLSFGTALGDHVGGQLFVEDPLGDEIERVPETIARVRSAGQTIRGARHVTRHRLLAFNGASSLHATMPFLGERYAIILFQLNASAIAETCELNKAYLSALGFRFFKPVTRDRLRKMAAAAVMGQAVVCKHPQVPPMAPKKRKSDE